jgi:hypothetical protein
MNRRKRQIQDIILVEYGYHLPYQITGQVNMIKPVFSENNKISLPDVPYAVNQTIPVCLYG